MSLDCQTTMKKQNQLYSANESETLNVLIEQHFPEADANIIIDQQPSQINENDFMEIDQKVTNELILKIINEFEKFKTPGIDEIYPVLLQIVDDLIAPILLKVIKFCLKTGFTPLSWQIVKVIFIPKPDKETYSDPRSYRPISLMSYLLKIIEKVVVELIEDKIKRVHKMQYAYLKERSAVEALNDVTHIINKRMNNDKLKTKKVTFATFADIEQAFDKPKFHRIKRKLFKYGVNPTIINWICNMNESRIIEACFQGESKYLRPRSGYGQGRVSHRDF